MLFTYCCLFVHYLIAAHVEIFLWHPLAFSTPYHYAFLVRDALVQNKPRDPWMHETRVDWKLPCAVVWP